MFKLTIAIFLIVTASITVNNKLFNQVEQTQPQVGTVVAYFENEYQEYAIELLTRENRLEQWSCLYTLWTRESNWNPNSLNRKSKAYGIAQFMPETWALVGEKRTSDGFKQVEAGLKYIDRKYGGNICKALGSNLARGWY